jgi:hypothetical protein
MKNSKLFFISYVSLLFFVYSVSLRFIFLNSTTQMLL